MALPEADAEPAAPRRLDARTRALLEALNAPQRRAVEHRGSPLLLLAGAGSGKTRVITVRIAHLIATGTPADKILALTFTNKAAAEMQERVAGLVGEERADALTIGTFHSLGRRIVNREAKALGLRPPAILIDANDQAVAIRQCLKSLRLDPRRHEARGLLQSISNVRNLGLGPEEVREQPGQKLIAQIYAAYTEWKGAHRVVDFDDLILLPRALLLGDLEARARWQGRYDHVLVDEYQDTNAVQLDLVRLLSEEHRNLTVVGDDDQSIYGWRGAQVENILRFETHFADARTLALEQNYRSTGHILGAANAVIAKNVARKAKRLWTDAGEGEKVRVVRAKDPMGEARYIAAQIHDQHHQHHVAWSDMGILFRAKSQAAPLEEALRVAGVPYSLAGAFAFYDRKEIKDILAYLRLVAVPHDRAAFVRVVNFPQRGIGPKRLEGLLALSDRLGGTALEACARADEVAGIQKKEAGALRFFETVVARARALSEAGRPHEDVTRFLLDKLEIRKAWIRDPTEGPGGQGRWKNAQRLLESMERWSRRNPRRGLKEWLDAVTLDAQDADSEEDKDAVSLLSIHRAKGLEWPVVFVVGCAEGLLPHQRTLDEGADLSEERRLFYVAATRAREHLYLTRATTRRTRTGPEPARPSRFLSDVPEGHRVDIDRTRGGGRLDQDQTRARMAALLDRLGGE